MMSDTLSTSHHRKQRLYDRLFQYSTQFFAFLVLALLAGIIGSLILGAMP